MKDYIAKFCDEFQYPQEAKEALLTTFVALEKCSEARNKFQRDILLYNQDRLEQRDDYSELLSNLDDAAQLAEVNQYSVHLLFMICLSKHLKEIYIERNISDDIYYDSMCDLKWKLFECHKMHGVWGTFVAFWHMGFFFLRLFALGRLQFELSEFQQERYEKDGYQLNKGDKVLNIHIPSSGSLKEEECFASYRKATEFFKDHFEGDVVPFVCCSWLLFPANREIMPATSNILTFMKHFDILKESIDEKGQDNWRIFYSDYKKPAEQLPRDTSIQRGYADWLLKGNRVGVGHGVFFFNGTNIL